MSTIRLEASHSTVSVRVQPCTREPLPWKEELYAAARMIASKSPRPLWLCSSGGRASEIMCHAFFDQGINFSVLTLALNDATYEHGTRHARTWCQKHNVHQEIIPTDIKNFLQQQIPNYIRQGYISPLLGRYAQIKLLETVEALGGFAVIGAGRQYYKVTAKQGLLSRNDTFLELSSDYRMPFEWSERNNTLHEPYFMYSTSELCLSYMRIPLINFVLDHPEILKNPNSGFTLERLVFQQYWPLHASRPKYRGIEKRTPETDALRQSILDEFGNQLRTYRLAVPDFIDQLLSQPR